MKYVKLYEEFQLGDLNFMSPDEIEDLFFRECGKETPNLELIRVILDNGLLDINGKEGGRTLLHWGVFCNNIQIIRFLIEMGADVNAVDSWGHTPLYNAHYLIRSKEMRDLLKTHGATF